MSDADRQDVAQPAHDRFDVLRLGERYAEGLVVERVGAEFDLHVVLAGEPPEQGREGDRIVADDAVDPAAELVGVDLSARRLHCPAVVGDQVARNHRFCAA